MAYYIRINRRKNLSVERPLTPSAMAVPTAVILKTDLWMVRVIGPLPMAISIRVSFARDVSKAMGSISTRMEEYIKVNLPIISRKGRER